VEIFKGPQLDKPYKVVLYGSPGVGKSTMANTAESPIFLDIENGLTRIDCHKTPIIKSISDLKKSVSFLMKSEEYKTVVLDTADALDLIISNEICTKADKQSLADFGYGAGYEMLNKTWNSILSGLDMLYDKGMNIIITAHPIIRTFQDPTGDAYDKYTLKIHQKPAGSIISRFDGVFFMEYEKVLKTTTGDKKRAIATGERILNTKNKLAFDAKNRFNLPDKIVIGKDFDLSIFEKMIRGEK